MRVSVFTAICLAWVLAVTFTGDLHATLLPGESINAEQATDKEHADSGQAVAFWDQAATWVWSKQREFHRALTRELRELGGKNAAGWGLVLMSFLYGVLHAAGPGHGKAVLTTYLLTHQHQLNRGVTMGTIAALLQGLTALLLVYGLTGLAGWLPRETETAALWAGRVSFGLLALVGFYIFLRAAPHLVQGIRQWHNEAHHTHHGHGAHHDHADHVHGESCGCRHLPTVNEIDTAGNRRAAAGVVLAIGLRPCTGAVLVLILASVMDLAWYGALAVLAMSIGTAITIVTLAVLVTKARGWASKLVEHRSSIWALAGGGIAAFGGVLLMLLGLLLLSASFSTMIPLVL
jgi:ABC-type nickel/cobalt efflux system permease component RcnA